MSATCSQKRPHNIGNARPLQFWVAGVVGIGHLGVALDHVAHVLHALPSGVKFLFARREGAGNFDDHAQQTDAAGPEQAVFMPRDRAHDACECACSDLYARDAQVARRARVERGCCRVSCGVGHGGHVHLLVGAAPIEDALAFEEDQRHVARKHVGKCAIEYRRGLDRLLVEVQVKFAAQIQVAVAAGLRLGEVERKIGGNKARHLGGDSRVEQHFLCVDDHRAQAREGRDHTIHAIAGLLKRCGVVHVELNDFHSEPLERRDFGGVATWAEDRAHVGTTCDKRLGDLAAEVACGTG